MFSCRSIKHVPPSSNITAATYMRCVCRNKVGIEIFGCAADNDATIVGVNNADIVAGKLEMLTFHRIPGPGLAKGGSIY